ncbi:MAG: hypothetical protein AB1689_00405, partial [Thermodesulfobacteriota bacterium]
MTRVRALLFWCALLPLAAGAGGVRDAFAAAPELVRGERLAWTHAARGPHVPISAPAVAVRADGVPLLAWIAAEGDVNHLWVVAPGEEGAQPVRVDPPGLPVDALHQAPALAVGPAGEVYASWSSVKLKPEGTLFASDLRLSRSLDGGRTFAPPLRVNQDRPISHSFDGLAVAGDGDVLLSWIDSRDGQGKAGTYLARVGERGSRVDETEQIGSETCVCCRVAVGARARRAAVLWRKDFPDQVRDMVLAASDDDGRTFAPAVRVSEDRWRMPACPHRGGAVGVDGGGKVYAAWYTEGTEGRPGLFFATSPDGASFGVPQRLDRSEGSIPDQVRLGVTPDGRVLVVWEDATAVRRRIVARASVDGGATFGPIEQL